MERSEVMQHYGVLRKPVKAEMHRDFLSRARSRNELRNVRGTFPRPFPSVNENLSHVAYVRCTW